MNNWAVERPRREQVGNARELGTAAIYKGKLNLLGVYVKWMAVMVSEVVLQNDAVLNMEQLL